MKHHSSTVFVTGCTGLIGRRLIRRLLSDGQTVMGLSRKLLPAGAFGSGAFTPVQGDPTLPGDWLAMAVSCDAVVHLAGEPILARRWSRKFVSEIRSSRVMSTTLLANALATNPLRADGTPRVFVSGSGVGYYGANPGDTVLTEASPAGSDAMAEICQAWEEAAQPAVEAGVRVCHPRTGVVLDPDGGALPKLMKPFRFFVGGRIGSGRQYVPWIHRDDMTGLLRYALETPGLAGSFNAVAPNAVTNAEFSRTLAKVLHRPSWLPVPGFALRVLLGKVAQVLTGGQRAVPEKALTAGYHFQYAELEPALRQLLVPAPQQ